MKKIIALSLIYFFCGLTSILNAQNEEDTSKVIDTDDPSQYLPAYLENVYMGMPLSDFSMIKDTLMMDVTDNVPDMWYGVREDVGDEGISEITYKFDKEENGVNMERPLYQVNIVFSNPDTENEFLQEKFGTPDKVKSPAQKEWTFKTNKNYSLIINQTNNEVQIISTMPGTEWESKK